MSSDLDTGRLGETEGGRVGRVPRPSGARNGERRGGGRKRLGGVGRDLARRDILGVDAFVLVILLVPLGLGMAEHLRTGYLFPPDSRYYVTMTYRDLGQTLQRSLNLQYHQTGWPAESWYFAHDDPVWLLVQPRMLYPFLSAPFVYAFGTKTGMLVVPVLAMVVTVWASARLVQRLYGPVPALVAAGALATTSMVLGLTEAITDPLAMAIIALMLLNLPIGRRAQGHNLVFLGVLSVLLCLTRQVLPMVAGMVFGAWLWTVLFTGTGTDRHRRLRNVWLVPGAIVAGVSLAAQVTVTLISPYDATSEFLYASEQPSVGAAFLGLPRLAWHMTASEISMMFRADHHLLALMIVPFVYLAVCFKDTTVGLFLGGLAGTYVLILANGIPSGMRYESVLFPLSVLCLGALVHRFGPAEPRAGSVAAGTNPDSGADPVRTWWQGGRRRVPALATACVATLALIVGWSASHGSASVAGEVPTSPSSAAAMAKVHLAKPAVSHDSAEQTLHYGLIEAVNAYTRKDFGLVGFLDWRHPVRYRPSGPADPGWNTRDADGTTVIRMGDYVERTWALVGGALSLRGSVVPDSIRVLTRATTPYGEDVIFVVSDQAGRMHEGRATVLYPVREHTVGLITEFVYTS